MSISVSQTNVNPTKQDVINALLEITTPIKIAKIEYIENNVIEFETSSRKFLLGKAWNCKHFII